VTVQLLQSVVLMSLTVLVMEQSVSQLLGYVMFIGKTVQMELMKPTANLRVVQMINLIVVMEHVSMTSGNVMAGLTVPMAQTKLIALLHHAKIKGYGTVAMASVSQRAMFVMAHMNIVTQAGAQTVPMARMKA
tara:strand:+ start:247 stop:645 length:399 start_codon:yes stop_codon:yes gene_type:complete